MKTMKCYQLLLLLASLVLALSCTLTSTPSSTPTPTSIPATATLLPCYILYANESSGYDIFVQNCDGSNTRRLTEGRTFGKTISWSPDGQHIIFDSLRPEMEWDSGEIYVMNADGSNKTRVLGPGNAYVPSWSPDGERIVFMDGCDIKTMRPDGSDIVLVMEHTELMMHAGDPDMCPFSPVWSPDSTQIAFYAPDRILCERTQLGTPRPISAPYCRCEC